MAVGRISGPNLKANLERNGIDLSFKDTLVSTDLLYLDVTGDKIGVNKGTPSQDLDIDGQINSTQVITTTGTIGGLRFENNNEINSIVGDLNLDAGSNRIEMGAFGTDEILINNNKIATTNSNQDLELKPDGSGIVDIFSNTNVRGNLHATGDISFQGNIVIGSDDEDDFVLSASIKTDILPNEDITHNLGEDQKRWNSIETQNFTGDLIFSNVVVLNGGGDWSLRQGNTFFVAVNGDDSATGDNIQDPFATLKHALDAADASTAGPVTIYVAPGEYQEELPLTVPSNVTVRGMDLRNTIIMPDTSSQSEDVFLLNGEATVSDLTIKDFYYDSINDKGYAFRFAPNTVVSTRSPYIQNITVITKGSVTSASDPRGFDEGDAGKGALIDGQSVNSSSKEASMLFHSCTFITPGVDAITMTNGVRVEWLNSFTYFANIGLKAINGAIGHLSSDGSTVKYGAEIRSIGSASVYGNYGAYADGADCLMYLIQHNLAYIGVGKRVDNDPSRTVQSQEITELNNANIYFQTVDHLGDFRVGDQFYASLEDGSSSLTIDSAEIETFGSLFVTTNGQTTTIDGDKVKTGNITLSTNTISSLPGEIEVTSANEINFTSDVSVAKDVSMTGDLTIGGSLITFGDQATDTVSFAMDFDQTLETDANGLYDIGTNSKRWRKAYLDLAQISDIQIRDNFITTTVSNADLELRANSIGRILLPDNNLEITNDLTVTGPDQYSAYLTNVELTGDVTHTGGGRRIYGQSTINNLTVTNNIANNPLKNDWALLVEKNAQFENILIDDNFITTTESNSDLDLRAAGTGRIYVPTNNVVIENNLIYKDSSIVDVNAVQSLSSVEANTDNIKIRDNFITTTVSNSDLELRASGTGGVLIEQSLFNENIYSTGNADSTEVDIVFTTDTNFDINSTGAIKIASGTDAQRVQDRQGNLRFNTESNLFEGYSTDIMYLSQLYSKDRETSVVAHPTDDKITMTITGHANIVNSSGIELQGLQVDDIKIDTNVITTNVSNSDLDFGTSGSGRILFEQSPDILIADNVFQNTGDSYAILKFATTDNGYAKFNTTLGVVTPKAGSAIQDNLTFQTLGTDFTDSVLFDSGSGVRIEQGNTSVTPTGNGISQATTVEVIGSTSTGVQNYRIDLGITDLSDIIDVAITQIRFRGNFDLSNEYVDITIPVDTGTQVIRIGEFEDNGNTSTYTTSAQLDLDTTLEDRTFSRSGSEAANFTSRVTESGGIYGIDVSVNVPATVDTAPAGMSNNWELEITVVARTNTNEFDKYEGTSDPNHYYLFDLDSFGNTNSDRFLVTETKDLTGFTGGRLVGRAIFGNNSNGGQAASTGDLVLQMSDDGTTETGMTNVVTVIPNSGKGAYSSWNTFTVTFDEDDLPDGFDLTNAKFRLAQTGGGDFGENPIGLADITLSYTLDVYEDAEGGLRYNPATVALEIYDTQTFNSWIPVTGVEENPVTDVVMEDLTNEWSLILG